MAAPFSIDPWIDPAGCSLVEEDETEYKVYDEDCGERNDYRRRRALADALGASSSRRAPPAGDDSDDGAESDGFRRHDADITRFEVLGGAVDDDVWRHAVTQVGEKNARRQ